MFVVLKHVHECSTFNSNVTHKTYNIVNPSLSMNCGTKNVIYLITCRKCGIQYVGEMGQSLRKRMNNHWNRLKKLSCQYLYQHFNSDGHTEDHIQWRIQGGAHGARAPPRPGRPGAPSHDY